MPTARRARNDAGAPASASFAEGNADGAVQPATVPHPSSQFDFAESSSNTRAPRPRAPRPRSRSDRLVRQHRLSRPSGVVRGRQIRRQPTSRCRTRRSTRTRLARSSARLTTVDPDVGDQFTYSVSDDRFEVVDGQLKLKDGVSLDHERRAARSRSRSPRPTAPGTRSPRASRSRSTTSTKAPSDIALSNATIAENAAGAVVGTLSTVDPDAGDSHTYVVSDYRFEVVDGQLKLKDGISLDHEAEPSVTVQVTSTDAGGLSISENFTITVENVNEGADRHRAFECDGRRERGRRRRRHALDRRSGRRRQPHLHGVRRPLRGRRRSTQAEGRRLARSRGRAERHGAGDIDRRRRLVAERELHDHGRERRTRRRPTSRFRMRRSPRTRRAPSSARSRRSIRTLATATPTSVSDDRFEVVGGQLKLKDGVALDHEAEPTIDVTLRRPTLPVYRSRRISRSTF